MAPSPDSYPVYLPPYWGAVIFALCALIAFATFFFFTKEKPLARRWKFLVIGLLLSSLSVYGVVEGNSASYNPWTQEATGPSSATEGAFMSHRLLDGVFVLIIVLLILLARDYKWMTWMRWWLDTFVFKRSAPDAPSSTR